MNRRSFLRTAVVLAPAVILTPGLLMPVRKPWIGVDFALANAERAFMFPLLWETNKILRESIWIEWHSRLSVAQR